MNGPTRSRAGLVALVVALGACGPASGPSGPSTSGEPPSASSSDVAGGGASSPPSAIANAVTPGPFGRHDTPPGGVADFVQFEGGAGGHCQRVGSGPPSVSLGLNSLPASMCASDFPPGGTVDMILTRPGEFEWRNQVVVDEFGVGEWDLADLPDPIVGDYTMLASQGDIQVEMTQTLEVNTLEAMFLPVPIGIGETGWLVLAGGLPLASAPAYLYYAPEDGFIWPDGAEGYRFVADVGPVELNRNGEGRIAFTPQAGDPLGIYMVVVNPRPAGAPTPEPSLPTLASVTSGDLTALADAYGMTCADSSSWIECNGEVGGVGVIMTIPTNDSGRLIGAWARADGPSDEVLPMFGELARVASGASEPEAWVRSATQWFKRRFGDVEVTLMDDLDGTWQVSIDPFTGSPTREVTASFAVQP